LEVDDHPRPQPLGQVNKYVNINVTKKCNIKISISKKCIDEVEVDVVPLYVRTIVFGIPSMHMRDAIFMRIENEYFLINDNKSFIINAHKGKSNISLVSDNHPKKLISYSKKFVLLLLRENKLGDESINVQASMEGCTKE
jgi:hypothetical protein